MKIQIATHDAKPLLDRSYSLSMTIRSFKGRKDVQVHLFRPQWDSAEEDSIDWSAVIGPPVDPAKTDPSGSRKVILEAFTEAERDTIVAYLKDQYSTRLTTIDSEPMALPIPAGLTGLSEIQAGKDIGFIEFEKIPVYSLDIPLKGLYDLSQHAPIVEE